MITQFLKECLFPALGFCSVVFVVGLGVCWLIHVIHSVSRAADALERIADALEFDEEDDAENNGKDLTPGTICAGSLRPPGIVPGASTTQNGSEME